MNEWDEVELTGVDGLLAGASNATFLARDHKGRPWVYKPERGERPLWDFPHGSLARREIACYRVSRQLDLDVVPETAPAHGPYGPGSAQRYLDEDLTWDPRPTITSADPSLWPVAVLDLIANNADRKVGHLLRQPDGDRIWAIDNGLTFHTEDKLRTVLWSFAGKEIPSDIIRRLEPDRLPGVLAGLLTSREIAAAVARTRRLVDHPLHPDPPNDRPPLPWPLW